MTEEQHRFAGLPSLASISRTTRLAVLMAAERLGEDPAAILAEIRADFIKERLLGWKAAAIYSGYSVTTLKKWYRLNPHFRKLVHKAGPSTRVWLYAGELDRFLSQLG